MRTPAVIAIVAIGIVATAADAARAACSCMIIRDPSPIATAKSARITNSATKVVLMRRGDKTTVVMSNDFDGDVQEFGLVMPVPALVEKRDVRLVDPAIFARLEKQTAPKIVRIEEQDPCDSSLGLLGTFGRGAGTSAQADESGGGDDPHTKSLGVTTKAKFAVGEYDITVLGAEQSTGLLTWLAENKYQVPREAADVLDSYIKQKSFFLVAKVDARRLSRTGRSFLKPLLVQFATPKFMLPIRLGMVNSDGLQELLVFTLAEGRVEPTNYREARLESGQSVPAFVADDPDAAFEQMFVTATTKHDTRAVFTEWAGWLPAEGLLPGARRWRVLQADPSSDAMTGQPPVNSALAGSCFVAPSAPADTNIQFVFGAGEIIVRPPLPDDEGTKRTLACVKKAVPEGLKRARIVMRVVDEAPSMFVTRLHFRYDEARFPEDLSLQVTADRKSIRTKWYARVPWRGEPMCTAAKKYGPLSDAALEKEIATYAELTGLSVDAVRARTTPK